MFIDALAVIGKGRGIRVAKERRGGASAVWGESENLWQARDEVGVAIPARRLMDMNGATMRRANFGEASEGVRHVVRAERAIVESGLVGVVDARQNKFACEMRNESGVRVGGIGIDALTEEAFAKVVDGVIGAAKKVERVVGRRCENAKGFRMRRRRMGRSERRCGTKIKAWRIRDNRKRTNNFRSRAQHFLECGREMKCRGKGVRRIFGVNREAR